MGLSDGLTYFRNLAYRGIPVIHGGDFGFSATVDARETRFNFYPIHLLAFISVETFIRGL